MSEKIINSSKLKHKAVFQYLKNKILTGHFLPGDQLPTEKSLVSHFGHSRPTIARALNDLESEGLITRKAGAGSFVSTVTQSASIKQNVFGLIAPGLGDNEIFDPICGSIAAESEKNDNLLLWGLGTDNEIDYNERVIQAAVRFSKIQADGVFFAPFTSGLMSHKEINLRVMEILHQSRIPLVLLNSDVNDFPSPSSYDVVSSDHFQAGYAVGKHLLEGHLKRLCFIKSEETGPHIQLRINGSRIAVAEYENENLKLEILTGDPEDKGFIELVLSLSTKDNKFARTGIICESDAYAGLLIAGLKKLKVNITDYLKLVSFDNTQYSQLIEPPLTTFSHQSRQIGIVAYDAMMSRLKTAGLPKREMLIKGELMKRESSN